MDLPEVQRCDLITGVHDYILTMRLPDMKNYYQYLRGVLAELPGVFGFEASVVIGKVKAHFSLFFALIDKGAIEKCFGALDILWRAPATFDGQLFPVMNR